MKKAVRIVAIISSIASVIGIIIELVALSNKNINWWQLIVSLIGIGIGLLLLWALVNALERIEKLENQLLEKGIIKKEVKEAADGERICKVCGYRLFNNERVCPRCNTPFEKEDELPCKQCENEDTSEEKLTK